MVIGSRRVAGTRQRAFCSFGARVGHAPPFLAVHGVSLGSTAVDLLLGGTSDGASPPRAAVSGRICHCLTAGSCFEFSLFSLYIPMCLLWIKVCLIVMHKCSCAYLVYEVD